MKNKNANILLGTFLIAFTTLALEITFSRLLSVTTWYHLAFFAIATAMLGMTAGATTVYLKPNWFTEEKLNLSIAKACIGYALVTPISLFLILYFPLILNVFTSNFLYLMIVSISCSLPFYFSGIAITAILTKSQMPIGILYASDLIGAALGCLFVVAGLGIFNVTGFIFLCGSIGVLAAFSFAGHLLPKNLLRLSYWLFSILVIFAFINSYTSYGFKLWIIKNGRNYSGVELLEKWNSYSRVQVYKRYDGPPQYWGASPIAPNEFISQYRMDIDGLAGTTIRKFSKLSDIDHLKFDVTNIGYYLRPKGETCIIGVGGARDIQSAILFGQEKIVGIDVNPIFINLLQGEFKDFAGVADREEVELITAEARSYLSQTEENFSIIQMSLIDTWAATGAGAFSLSENALYTVEAWQTFFNRLSNDGIFTVSRWYHPDDLGETGRIVSLAAASLIQFGIKNPSQHIVLVASDKISTLLVSRQPFSKDDIIKLNTIISELKYKPLILPGVNPRHQSLKNLVNVRSFEELNTVIKDEPLNYKPPTDEQPYFFNMLRLNHIDTEIIIANQRVSGVVHGNLVATQTLVRLIFTLFLLTLATIVIPLLIKIRLDKKKNRPLNILWSGALYFSLIGAGFMFMEIALLQRLSIFLTHPIYSLGILLFTIIISTGVGSFLSEYIPLTRTSWLVLSSVLISIAIVIANFYLPSILTKMITSSTLIKIIVSVLVISPLGVIMGIFFPLGMRLFKSIGSADTPWYWALNGIFGVLSSALAVFVSIYVSISLSFYIAAICYSLLLIPIFIMYRARQNIPVKPAVKGAE